MKTEPKAAAAFPLVPYRQAPLVLLLLVVSLLAMTWPWAKTFSNAVLDHWDPPFHAWKLEFVARTILSGHLLPPDGDTNMYYPHSGTLYFEALHWPQALVAAPLFALPNISPVLVYHVVLVFFWALSGLCFWLLLLALNATRRAALLGALLFTLMPYRISYALEFNMQLCFGLPLFFFFMVRYFQRPSVRYACGMALAWWLQASSELYQAVFLLLILPFPALALLTAQWRLLGSFRRFWLPAFCAAALGGTLTWIFIGPYLTMLNVHAVNRNLLEISTHVLEPLSYLRPGGRFHILPPMDARRDEMTIYPTLAMILLTVLHLVFDARRLSRISVPPRVWVCRAIRWTALIAFFLLTFGIYFLGAPNWINPFYAALPVIATLAAVLVLFHPTERDPATLFVTGLFAGAIFAFFLGMGPLLIIRHASFSTFNFLYLWIYNHLSALQGFRVVSRFSIFVLIFMAIASALAWSRIERRWLKSRALRWLWIAPLLLAIPECLPKGIRVKPLACPFSTPVLDRLDQRKDPYVIAMLPMGDRNRDSIYMLQVARTDRLFVYAWGGAYPQYTRQVRDAMDPATARPAEAAELLRQLWPECLILEDKIVTRTRRSKIRLDYAQLLAGETAVIDEDDRFALLRLKPKAEPSTEQIRLIRHDFLAANPVLAFRAGTPAAIPSGTLWLDVNGYVAGRWEITPEPQEFHLAIPSCYFLARLPNRFRFHATGDAPFLLNAFDLAPLGSDLPPPADESVLSTNLPWLGHIGEVPDGGIPLDIHYRNGFAILACEPVETVAAPGESIRLRHFVRCPRDLRIAANISVCARLRAPDGQWIEEGITLADTGDLQDVQCQLHPGIYDLEQSILIPERLAPGNYTLFLLLRDNHSQRITGKQNGKRGKLFPVPIPIRIQAPAAP